MERSLSSSMPVLDKPIYAKATEDKPGEEAIRRLYLQFEYSGEVILQLKEDLLWSGKCLKLLNRL